MTSTFIAADPTCDPCPTQGHRIGDRATRISTIFGPRAAATLRARSQECSVMREPENAALRVSHGAYLLHGSPEAGFSTDAEKPGNR